MRKQQSNKTEAFNRLAAHITATAPDSISNRIQLLTDLLEVLPKNHKRVEMVRTALNFLQHHQQTQMQLPLAFLADLKGAK